MTQDVYMGCKVVDARVAEALEDALGKTTYQARSSKKREQMVMSEQTVSGDPPGDGSPLRSCSDRAP